MSLPRTPRTPAVHRPMRRLFVAATVSLGLLAAAPAQALEAVKMMIPANPGGGYDRTGRTLGKAMQQTKVAKTVQYDNKAGAGGVLGMVQFVNAAKNEPGGLLIMGAILVTGIIQNKPPVGLDAASPVARLYDEFNVFVVPTASPYKSMADVVAAMKKDPGSVKWGGGSKGSIDHLSVGLIARQIGIEPSKANYIPMPGGGESVAAILGGHLNVGTGGLAEYQQYLSSGKMRALAITAPKRLEGVDIPTLKEQGIDVEISNWRGVYGAPGLSAEQQQAQIDAVKTATQDPVWLDALKTNQWFPQPLYGKDFGRFVADEQARLGAVMKELGLVAQ